MKLDHWLIIVRLRIPILDFVYEVVAMAQTRTRQVTVDASLQEYAWHHDYVILLYRTTGAWGRGQHRSEKSALLSEMNQLSPALTNVWVVRYGVGTNTRILLEN